MCIPCIYIIFMRDMSGLSDTALTCRSGRGTCSKRTHSSQKTHSICMRACFDAVLTCCACCRAPT